jgi:hypothetical protein
MPVISLVIKDEPERKDSLAVFIIFINAGKYLAQGFSGRVIDFIACQNPVVYSIEECKEILKSSSPRVAAGQVLLDRKARPNLLTIRTDKTTITVPMSLKEKDLRTRMQVVKKKIIIS